MKEQEKLELFRELSARLPYNLICNIKGVDGYNMRLKGITIMDNGDIIVKMFNGEYMPKEYYIDEVKPYLRHMSSMTDDEQLHVERYFTYTAYDDWDYVRWLNERGFDYLGMIENGLALEWNENIKISK